jgi:hypothetical protein
LSCYDGGVRLFHPGLSQNSDPYKHTLWLRSFLEKKPLPVRSKIIANSIAASVVGSRVPPSFARLIEDFDVQAARSKTAHMAAFGDAAGQILAFENQVKILDEALASSRAEASVIPGLRRELETYKSNANIYLEACDEAERGRDYFKDELDKTRRLLFNLRTQLNTKESGPTEVVIPIPETYDELPQWVEAHLAGHLVLHPRAKKGLKDADYENIEQVYRALILLGNEYRGMRMGLEGFTSELFDSRCAELELEFGRSITPSRAGEFHEDYFAKWPVGSENEEFIEFHLRKGTSKETRYCLAIYFFWDSRDSQVVVCWMPSHLSNRMT